MVVYECCVVTEVLSLEQDEDKGCNILLVCSIAGAYSMDSVAGSIANKACLLAYWKKQPDVKMSSCPFWHSVI